MAKKYNITHSNFTVKKKHKTIDGERAIYERDYMILNNKGRDSDGTLNDGSSSFKITRNIKSSGARKHRYGNWVKNEGSGSEFWTINNVDTKVSSENKLTIKPNYNSLLEFAYYGSCVELLKSTVNKIIDTFPGELCFTNYQYTVNGKTMYLVDNPFGIKLYGATNTFDSNNIRDFNSNYSEYIKYKGGSEEAINGITISNISKNYGSCHKNWDLLYKADIGLNFTIYAYYYDGDEILLCDQNRDGKWSIRPSDKHLKTFFENLDDFGKMMLNRYSVPKYTMVLDRPHETENGIETYKERFTWPISNKGSYNLDITSGDFSKYINELLELCTFYDNRQTNNLWRMLTHDSIKNMDGTFKKSEGDILDYSFGTSKIEGLFMAIGRQFDEIKRYADNIKSCNIISYNDNNNIPNYLLSDKLNLSGWDITSVAPDLSNNITQTSQFTGDKSVYKSSDINNNFLRFLQINSKNILSRKGTKHGIEMLLSLFGLKSYQFTQKLNQTGVVPDYSINEYVNVVSGFTGDMSAVTEFNQMVKNFTYESEEGNIETNYLQGLPVRMVELYNSAGELTMSYIIPWFDKYQELYGKPYFQMYGGWCKLPEKKIVHNGNEITLKGDSDNVIYDESVNYLQVVRKKTDLYAISIENAIKGTIYYVVDINEDESNYFILDNESLYNSEEGWKNIPTEEISEATSPNSIKVLYLESIIDNNEGNNPHSGNGKYDSGAEYLRYFKELFRGAIKENLFGKDAYDCEGKLNETIEKIGFSGLIDDKGSVIYKKDNVKVWYFSNGEPDEFYVKTNNNKYEKCQALPVGRSGDRFTFFDYDFIAHGFGDGYQNEEPAANSIINNKLLRIKFRKGLDFEYINRAILPYLKQMIPSTTILEIEIGDLN